MTEIRTIQELESLTDLVFSGDMKGLDIREVRFALPPITYHFTDGDHNGTMDTDMMRIMIRLQNRIYKDLGFAIYGKRDIRKLTREEKESLKIRVQVSSGSIIDKLDFSAMFNTLVEGMDSEDKMKMIIIMTAIGCLTFFLVKGVGAIFAYKAKKLDNNLTTNALSEYNKLSAQVFSYLADKDNVSINGEHLEPESLQEYAKERYKTARDLSSDEDEVSLETISGTFLVTEFKNEPEYSVVLTDMDTGESFRPRLGSDHHPNMDKLALAASKKEPVGMALTLVRYSDGSLAASRIEKIGSETFLPDLLSEVQE